MALTKEDLGQISEIFQVAVKGLPSKADLEMASLATRNELQTVMKGLSTKDELRATVSALATKDELRVAVSGLASKDDLQMATANLATTNELQAAVNGLASKDELLVATNGLASRDELKTGLDSVKTEIRRVRSMLEEDYSAESNRVTRISRRLDRTRAELKQHIADTVSRNQTKQAN